MISLRTSLGSLGAWMASAVLLGVLAFPGKTEAQGQRGEGRGGLVPLSLGTMGLPGLISIPNAGTITPGYAHLSYNTTPTYDAFAPGAIARQYNIQFAVGLFSRLVISGRGSEVVASEPLPPKFERGPDGVIRQVEWTALSRYLSASAQLLLLEETAFRPAVAIGAQDFGGASNHFEARYAVAGKTLAGRVRLTAGYGWGDDLLKGAFGGIEASPIRQVTLVGEYDAERFNGSLRIRPLPERLVARGAPRPTVDVIWTEGEGVTWGVSLRAVLDQDWIEREPAREVGQGPGPAITEPGVDAVDVLARLLAEDGFENVQVSVREGDVLRVEYENRRYNQHELDGLAQVFRIVSRNMPAGAENLRIVVKRTNLRVAQIDVTSADLRHFLDGSIGPEVFRNRVSIRHPGAPRSLAGPASRSVNSSFFKADLTLHPGIETVVYSDFGVADARLFLLPNLRIALFRGTVLEAQYRLPIGQTEGYERAAGPLPDPELDRLLLHHAAWWSLDPCSITYATTATIQSGGTGSGTVTMRLGNNASADVLATYGVTISGNNITITRNGVTVVTGTIGGGFTGGTGGTG